LFFIGNDLSDDFDILRQVKSTYCIANKVKSLVYNCSAPVKKVIFKGELGNFQIYFRKISLHQQKFLVVLVLSNLPWLLKNLKKCPK